MTLVDRFICRREGHLPILTLKRTSGIRIRSYVTACQRCGKVITVEPTAEDVGKPLGSAEESESR